MEIAAGDGWRPSDDGQAATDLWLLYYIHSNQATSLSICTARTCQKAGCSFAMSTFMENSLLNGFQRLSSPPFL